MVTIELGAGWTPELSSTFWKREKYLEIFAVKDVEQRRLRVTDVWGEPVGPIFNSQAAQEEFLLGNVDFLLDCWTIEDGTHMLSQNFGN